MRRYHISGSVTFTDGYTSYRDLTVSILDTCQMFDDWRRVAAVFLAQPAMSNAAVKCWRVNNFERIADCEEVDN